MTLKRLLGLDTRADRYSYEVDPVAGYVSSQRVPDKWVATTCGYCSVGCGMFIGVKGGRAVSVRGNPDHPVNRGTLCPKGAALLDFVHSETRLKYPMHRKPGSDKFEKISWDQALDRIARLMKDDRDKNFVAKNSDGVTVNRWLTTGFLAASASNNEAAWATYKVVRSLGILAFDNQARV